MESLADWLQEKCSKEHLSLRKMSIKTGLSHATIQDALNGKRPLPETIGRLAKGFGGGEALELCLLELSGYKVNFSGLTPKMAEVMDKIVPFNDTELELMLSFADFVITIKKEEMCNT